MNIDFKQVDVLVVGAGLAGTQAALTAAQEGARVAIASASHIFSGLSFSKNTWGLGVVAPKDASDIDDLVQTITDVGQGCVQQDFATFFVEHIPHAISEVERWGVRFVTPAHEEEKAYIPCFDKHTRRWRGLRQTPYIHTLRRKMQEFDILELPYTQFLDIIETGQTTIAQDVWDWRFRCSCTTDTPPLVEGLIYSKDTHERRIQGALLADMQHMSLLYVQASSVVFACGGISGLFSKSFASHIGYGVAHTIGISHFTYASNLEFMQIMPTIINAREPFVFNEKTYRYATLYNQDKQPLYIGDETTEAKLLELRSMHGPFTSRLSSKLVDLAMVGVYEHKSSDVGTRTDNHESYARYTKLEGKHFEFVQMVFDQMKKAHIDIQDYLKLAFYAHASNGGLAIDTSCHAKSFSTQALQGLFAAGEITAGMHGADRIGGLSSANCMVFGQIAGREAATWAKGVQTNQHGGTDALNKHPQISIDGHTCMIEGARLALAASPQASFIIQSLQEVMYANCMLLKDNTSMMYALTTIGDLHKQLIATKVPSTDSRDIAETICAQHMLTCAKLMITTMLQRTESRGSFWRKDFSKRVPSLAFPSFTWIEE